MQVVHIAYFGDSITHGLGHDHKGVREEKRWTALLDAELKKLEGEGIFCWSRNMGVNGDTTRNGLERLPEVYAFSPQVMTLQFGMNDCNCWMSDNGYPRVGIEAFEFNLQDIVQKCEACGVQKIILCTNHLIPVQKLMLNGADYNENNRMYNEAIRTIPEAMDGIDITLCDIEVLFGDAPKEDFLDEHGKWIHLSEQGNERYFRCIAPYVENAVKGV